MERRRRRWKRMNSTVPEPSLGIEFMKLGFLGFAMVLASTLLIGAFTNFVASDAWFCWSLPIAAALIAVTYAVLFRHLRAKFPAPLHEEKIGIAGGIVVLLIFVLPFGWLLLLDAIGDPFARRYGVVDKIFVQAIKREGNRRYSCDLRLEESMLGDKFCLSRDEFDRLPRKVTVELTVRRSVLGYHIDWREIVPNVEEKPVDR